MARRASSAEHLAQQIRDEEAYLASIEAFCTTMEADGATLVFSTGLAAPPVVTQTLAGPCSVTCECHRCWSRSPALLTRDDLGVACAGFDSGAVCPSCMTENSYSLRYYPLFTKAAVARSIRQTAQRYTSFQRHKTQEDRLSGLVSLSGRFLARDWYAGLDGKSLAIRDTNTSEDPAVRDPPSGSAILYLSSGKRVESSADIVMIGDRCHWRRLVDEGRDVYGLTPLFTAAEITAARGYPSFNQTLTVAARDAAATKLEDKARYQRFEFEYPSYASFLRNYQGDNAFILRLCALHRTTARFSTPEMNALDRAMVVIKQSQPTRRTSKHIAEPQPSETLRLSVEVLSCRAFQRPSYHKPEVMEDVNHIEMRDEQGRRLIAKASRLSLPPGSQVRLMMTQVSQDGVGADAVCQVNRLFLLDADNKVVRARKAKGGTHGGPGEIAALAAPAARQSRPGAAPTATKPARRLKLR